MNFSQDIESGARAKIEENWPRVQKAFQEKVGPAALAAARNDEQMTTVFKMVHQALPFPLRMLIKEPAFVQFCLAHRDSLLPPNAMATPDA